MSERPSATTWRTVRCRVAGTDAAPVEDVLAALGAASVSCEAAEQDRLVVDDRGEMRGQWSACVVSGLFDHAIDTDVLETRLRARGVGHFAIEQSCVVAQDWQHAWREHFKPQVFGARVWVCPSWCQAPEHAEHVIRIDPGMAFGTGQHETTAMCLDWLSAAHELTDANVLDYGCGSGILAITAARLGARAVTAVDIDPGALEVAADNARRNAIDNIVLCEPQALDAQDFDIIIANILFQPLRDLVGRFRELCTDGGQIVLSGVLSTQVEPLLAAYTSAFTMFEREQQGDWVRLSGRRRDEDSRT